MLRPLASSLLHLTTRLLRSQTHHHQAPIFSSIHILPIHHNHKMSTITVSDLTYVSSSQLANLILSSPSKIAIIDVRDSDHIGGNIVGSTWIPLHNLELHLPELLRVHNDKEKIVFHCMLSQQRGPSAALRYKRALIEKQKKEQKEGGGKQEKGEEGKKEGKGPEVCVLQGGFGSWAPKFGTDERLTRDFAPDLWESGMMG